MARVINLYGPDGEAIRTAVATASSGARFGEDGCNAGLLTFTNGLDQNVTFTTQGMNFGDTVWQTVAADVVAAGASGSRSLTVPWGLLRVSALAAGVPTSGVVQARLTKVR